MTDNTEFKRDATALLESYENFKRRYLNFQGLRGSSWERFEHDLRALLRIARTDEENEAQRKRDSMI